MSDSNAVSEKALDYDTIVAAVLETPRGRWFLHEHESRIRASETRSLLAAIARLEASLVPAIGAQEANDRHLEGLAAMLQATRADIAEIGHPLLEGGGAIPAGADAFDFMATSAKAVAEEVTHTAAALQSTSLALRVADGVEAETAALEREAAKLLTVAYQQEVLSQRVVKAAGALTDMDQRLKGHTPRPRTRAADPPRTLSADQLKYFRTDEEMFVRPPFPRPPAVAPPAASTQQVVVIRRASGDIPFMGEDASPAAGV